MHESDLNFARKHAHHFQGRVLEVGAMNVNGSIREAIPVTIGVDMQEGKDVDLVLDASELVAHFGPESFDAVTTSGSLEHMEDWKAAMENMWGVLKTGGYAIFGVASLSKHYHGYPDDFHRWPMERYKAMFGANPILDTFDGHPSMGVLVRKEGPLDLTQEPDPVKR